jgi:hypothetical protein
MDNWTGYRRKRRRGHDEGLRNGSRIPQYKSGPSAERTSGSLAPYAFSFHVLKSLLGRLPGSLDDKMHPQSNNGNNNTAFKSTNAYLIKVETLLCPDAPFV